LADQRLDDLGDGIRILLEQGRPLRFRNLESIARFGDAKSRFVFPNIATDNGG